MQKQHTQCGLTLSYLSKQGRFVFVRIYDNGFVFLAIAYYYVVIMKAQSAV